LAMMDPDVLLTEVEPLVAELVLRESAAPPPQ
jgi:hypothetical protein